MVLFMLQHSFIRDFETEGMRTNKASRCKKKITLL
jgi:hypothetical protein